LDYIKLIRTPDSLKRRVLNSWDIFFVIPWDIFFTNWNAFSQIIYYLCAGALLNKLSILFPIHKQVPLQYFQSSHTYSPFANRFMKWAARWAKKYKLNDKSNLFSICICLKAHLVISARFWPVQPFQQASDPYTSPFADLVSGKQNAKCVHLNDTV